MAKRKNKKRFGAIKSIHAVSDMKAARNLLRLARSNAVEGWCGHALNHLTEAARHIGMAQGHESEASGRSTSKGSRDMRDTLRNVSKRVLACAKKPASKY